MEPVPTASRLIVVSPATMDGPAQSTQGTSLEHLALVPRRLVFLGPTGMKEPERPFLAIYNPQDTAA